MNGVCPALPLFFYTDCQQTPGDPKIKINDLLNALTREIISSLHALISQTTDQYSGI
jgi:hypothetical protein